MKLIIGLGNPGTQYEHTRHNAGFLCADWLREEWKCAPFVLNKKMSSAVSGGSLENEKVLIVKPQTFMNNSGEAVRALWQFYKLAPSDIAVIHDDLDIAWGKFKVSDASRSGGHLGVQSIIDALGTQNFPRVRIGIGRPASLPNLDEQADTANNYVSPEAFVLQNFSSEELATLTKLFPEVKNHLRAWLKTEDK